MPECQDLIVEIGSEELPPMSLNKMSLAFATQIKEQMTSQGLSFGEVYNFATPRRIAVLIKNLATKSLIKSKDRSGREPAGSSQAAQMLPAIIEKAANNLPSPKMHWGAGDFSFARPVHWLLVLFGGQIININLFGVKSGNRTYGHRFLAPQAIVIKCPSEYEAKLYSKGMVIADFNKRKQAILEGIGKQEQKEKASCIVDPVLLEQVTNMVEYPTVLCASFSDKFLQLPKECLISVMGHHQKSFALLDQQQHRLLPKFLLISNLPIKDVANIVNGNQKIMHARLQDAMFLYQQDLQTSMENMLQQLKTVVLEEKLGSLYEQANRISEISGKICELLGGRDLDILAAKQAGLLCKADLVSKMVLEFPELQGIMGRHYLEQTLPQQPTGSVDVQIAQAVSDHYLPKFAEDRLPDHIYALSVGIAYRLNLLCGMFAIGVVPTGDRDPFALRRHALAIIRMLIEKQLPLNIIVLFEITLGAYQEFNQLLLPPNVSKKLLDFCIERLKNWYVNSNTAGLNVINAVLVKFTGDLHDFDLRVRAIIEFSKHEEFTSLSVSNKRVSKLLSKSGGEFIANLAVDDQLFTTEEESKLFNEILNLQTTIKPLLSNKKYNVVLNKLVILKPFIDQFFDKVMVMVPDLVVRNNRLSLLLKLRELFLQVADIAEI